MSWLWGLLVIGCLVLAIQLIPGAGRLIKDVFRFWNWSWRGFAIAFTVAISILFVVRARQQSATHDD